MQKRLYLLAAAFFCLFSAQAQYLVWHEVLPTHRLANITEFQVIPYRGGKIVTVHQGGLIRVLDLDSASLPADTFGDLSYLTTANGEMGLLGFAWHPRYPAVNKIYVNYVDNKPGHSLRTVIASFSVDTANLRLDTSSRVEIITYPQPYTNHKGGKIEFGPDSMLYIGAGDGGSANDPPNNGQRRDVLLGKILRIDINRRDSGRNYAIPPDNPFVDSGAAYRKEIYSRGMRNPWRFSWDVPTMRLWCGDVGQGQREEVDTIVAGGNYGWRWREGFICNPAYTLNCNDVGNKRDPVWDYSHSLGVSITGGYVYRGSQIPFLYGQYVYADYGSGRVWGLKVENGVAVNTLLLTAIMPNNAPAHTFTFGRDRNGELYLCEGPNGALLKLEADLTATAPKANLAQVSVYPNPARDLVSVDVTLPKASVISIKTLTLDGRLVSVVTEGKAFDAGLHRVPVSMAGLAAGTYLVRVQTDDAAVVKRITVAR